MIILTQPGGIHTWLKFSILPIFRAESAPQAGLLRRLRHLEALRELVARLLRNILFLEVLRKLVAK